MADDRLKQYLQYLPKELRDALAEEVATLDETNPSVEFLTPTLTGFDGDPNTSNLAAFTDARVGSEYQQSTPKAATWKKQPDGSWTKIGSGGGGWIYIEDVTVPGGS
ncbi:MAG: hypothetical protein ACXABY_24360, partial [Candidatus Thorarchaeota archaeon]